MEKCPNHFYLELKWVELSLLLAVAVELYIHILAEY